jgi:hypothetical protein
MATAQAPSLDLILAEPSNVRAVVGGRHRLRWAGPRRPIPPPPRMTLQQARNLRQGLGTQLVDQVPPSIMHADAVITE